MAEAGNRQGTQGLSASGIKRHQMKNSLAQGMSDVLRCPVCSCAHSFYPLHMRPRVQRASGIPCALFSIEGEELHQTSGATRREIAKVYPPSLRAQRSNLWRSKKKEWIASSLALLAMTVGFAGWAKAHLRRAHHLFAGRFAAKHAMLCPSLRRRPAIRPSRTSRTPRHSPDASATAPGGFR